MRGTPGYVAGGRHRSAVCRARDSGEAIISSGAGRRCLLCLAAAFACSSPAAVSAVS